ncbi:ERC protein 2-like [Pecten maximus]|uniref:ERC protein 2-like n=1 Tax=Pecten maximus TaxID=6579 RepID=UPI0014591152|nr:ERC protein 2-like [Pecten maximus]
MFRSKSKKRSQSQTSSSAEHSPEERTNDQHGPEKTNSRSPSHGSGSKLFSGSLPKNIFSRSRRSSGGSKDDKKSQGNQSSNSAINLPNDTMQSFTAGYPSMNHGSSYSMIDGIGSANTMPSPGSSKSPYSSPTNSNTNSLNVRALKDRYERDHQHGLFMGERSLERNLDRLQLSARGDLSISPAASPRSSLGFSANNKCDRSIDREYPHMGARSLERSEQPFVRSRSSERPDYTTQLFNSQEMKHYRDQDMRSFRDTLILDFQAQIADLNKECAKMQQELDSTKDKLSSSMNSIKTFWSPELKKERALRKEESAKYCLLNEQLKVAQAEFKKQSSTIKDLESKLFGCEDVDVSRQISQQEIEILQREKDKQSKEIVILKKTVEEMEIRIETQKQTLSARDESIKKLLEMLQSKGLSSSAQKIEAERKEMEKLQTKAIEGERKVRQLQTTLSHRERDLTETKEENSRLSDELEQIKVQLKQQPASTHTMQAMLEAKDGRILALEREVQGLEDKLMRLQEEGTGTTESQKKDGSLKDSLSSKEKSLRNEIEHLKKDLANKDTEILGLKLKVEASKNQNTEQVQYVDLLKDQISAKEKHVGMLQADIEDLRERLKDKDSTIDRKAKHSHNLQTEKRKIEGEIGELKDQIEIKDRKINVLQRKIEGAEESIDNKDDEIQRLKSVAAAATVAMDSFSSDSAISSMEESLNDKDRQIEKLKDLRERTDLEHQEECDMYIKTNQNLKARLDDLQLELTDKQTELFELREQATVASEEKFQLENKVRQLDHDLQAKEDRQKELNTQLDELKKGVPETKNLESFERQVTEMTSQLEQARNEVNKAHAEADRLQGIVKEAEAEKSDKDAQITELQDIIKEYKQKVGTLKRNKQAEKKKSAHLLEEARKREGDLSDDATQLQDKLISQADRIEELEEALKESVKITAEREMAMVEVQAQLDETRDKVSEVTLELNRQKSLEQSEKLVLLNKQLEEKDHKLKRLMSERHKHLEEVYEMKQEAIQAAISEKDANIALLEMTSTKKQRNNEEIDKLNKEKEKLQNQLKEVTQNRMKLIHRQEKKAHRRRGSTPDKSEPYMSRGSTPDKSDPYVLTAPESLDPDLSAPSTTTADAS